MKAAVLSIGDEILAGFILNANARTLSQMLIDEGYEVNRHLSVGDEITTIVEACYSLAEDRDLVMVTGGLGPTHDDKTMEACALAMGVETAVDKDSLERLQDFFTRRGRTMKDIHRRMATFPIGATVVPNPVGAADGFTFTLGDCQFLCMPGVPAEMNAVATFFLKHYQRNTKERCYRAQRILSLCGVPESEAALRMQGLLEGDGYKMGLLPNDSVLRIRISSQSEQSSQHAVDIAENLIRRIAPLFKPHEVFSYDNEELHVVILQELQKRNWQLALAESCTGGRLCDTIVAVSGASQTLVFGGVFYANSSKEQILKVLPDTIETHGAVSEPVAEQMAQGVCALSNAHCSIATTGVAGPDGGTDDKPVGTVCIATKVGDKVESRQYLFSGNRELIRRRASQAALIQLLRQLRDQQPSTT